MLGEAVGWKMGIRRKVKTPLKERVWGRGCASVSDLLVANPFSWDFSRERRKLGFRLKVDRE